VRHQRETEPVGRHHGPVLHPRDVVEADRVPGDDVAIAYRPVARGLGTERIRSITHHGEAVTGNAPRPRIGRLRQLIMRVRIAPDRRIVGRQQRVMPPSGIADRSFEHADRIRNLDRLAVVLRHGRGEETRIGRTVASSAQSGWSVWCHQRSLAKFITYELCGIFDSAY
jgi:hypothetical protein